MATRASAGLVGQWFHTFEPYHGTTELVVTWQGQVVAQVEPGWYLVQLYDWMVGAESRRAVVRLEEMTPDRWWFYETQEEMIASYQHGPASVRRIRVERNGA